MEDGLGRRRHSPVAPVRGPLIMRRDSERGLTLTEVTVVTALAGLVMVGMVSFYLNSQGLWLDSSAQALTQREATLILETFAAHVRAASSSEWSPDYHSLTLHYDDGPDYKFTWRTDLDSMLYAGADGAGSRVGLSKVARFEVSTSPALVNLDTLVLVPSNGHPIGVSSSFALYNRSAE